MDDAHKGLDYLPKCAWKPDVTEQEFLNAYAEPVVSLDLDFVIAVDAVDKLLAALVHEFRIERFPHSINLRSPRSDLRFQIQTDTRYQAFLSRAVVREVLGYSMNVASLKDGLHGKI